MNTKPITHKADYVAPNEGAALVSAAIAASRLSAHGFAAEIMAREYRTIARWLTGESPVPEAALKKCRDVIEQAMRAADLH